MARIDLSNSRSANALGRVALSGAHFIDRTLPGEVAGAWSTMRLTAAYSGPCLRTRRASDNVEADVFFDADGVLSMNSVTRRVDTSATALLSAFHGGGECTVVSHYDQIGGVDTTVFPADFQPKLVVGGALLFGHSPAPVIAHDEVLNLTEIKLFRQHPHFLLVSGSTPVNGAKAKLVWVDGYAVSRDPVLSGGSLVVRDNAVPGGRRRSLNAGLGIGDGTADDDKYKTYAALFASAHSKLYDEAGLVAAGDAGEDPPASLLVGMDYAGTRYNASYHTLIAGRGGAELDLAAAAAALHGLYAAMTA